MIPGIQCILGALDLDSQNTLKIFPGWLLQKPMYYPFLGPGSNNTLKIPPPGWLTSASNFQRLIDKPKKRLLLASASLSTDGPPCPSESSRDFEPHAEASGPMSELTHMPA